MQRNTQNPARSLQCLAGFFFPMVLAFCLFLDVLRIVTGRRELLQGPWPVIRSSKECFKAGVEHFQMSGEGFGHCEGKETLETQVLNFPFQTTGCSISLPVKVEGSCMHKSARFYIPKGRDRACSKCFPFALCRQSQVIDRCHVRIFYFLFLN